MAGYLEFFFLADARLVDGSRRSGERTKRDTKFHGSFECCLDIKNGNRHSRNNRQLSIRFCRF